MKKLLTAADIVERGNVCKSKAYDLMNTELPVIRFGRSIRVLEEDWDEWLEARRDGGVVPLTQGEPPDGPQVEEKDAYRRHSGTVGRRLGVNDIDAGHKHKRHFPGAGKSSQ